MIDHVKTMYIQRVGEFKFSSQALKDMKPDSFDSRILSIPKWIPKEFPIDPDQFRNTMTPRIPWKD